jgi:hypothetical protein
VAEESVDLLHPDQDEGRTVLYLRYQEARRAGLSIVEARLFAESDQDVGLLRKLVKASCDPRLIAQIVL